MAIQRDNSNTQIQQQAGIANTADLNIGNEVLQSQLGLHKILNNFGNAMVDKFGADLGKENADKDIAKQQELIAHGEDGTFSNLGGIVSFLAPQMTKAYNDTMDKIAPAMYSSQANMKTLELANQIKLNTEIPVENKVAELSKQFNASLPDTLKDIPDEYKTTVSSMVYSQANQEMHKMIGFAGQVQSKQLEYQSYQSMEDLATLGRNSTTINDANNYIKQIDNVIQAGVDNGNITPLSAKAMSNQYSTNVLGYQAVNAGIKDVDTWAKDNDITLDPEKKDAIQLMINQHYTKQQNQIETEQLQNGFSFQEDISRIRDGQKPMKPMSYYSDREIANIKNAQYLYGQSQYEDMQRKHAGMVDDIRNSELMGQLYNTFKTMNPADKQNLKAYQLDNLPEQYKTSISAYQALPNKYKTMLLANINGYDNTLQSTPVEMLNLPKADFNRPNGGIDINNRVSIIQQAGGNIKELASQDELKQLVNIGTTNPYQMEKSIEQTYGNFAPIIRDKVAQMQPEVSAGYKVTSYAPTEFKDAYSQKPSITKLANAKWVNSDLNSRFGSNYLDAIGTLTPIEAQQTIGYVNGVVAGLGGTKTPREVLNSTFDTIGNKLIRKGDDVYLKSMNFTKLLGENKIDDPTAFTYAPSSDRYNMVNKDGEVFSISGEKLRSIPTSTLLDRLEENNKQKISKLKSKLVSEGTLLNE
jgi:hypothetical protein